MRDAAHKALTRGASEPARAQHEFHIGRASVRALSHISWIDRCLAGHVAGAPAPARSRSLELLFSPAGGPRSERASAVSLAEYHCVLRRGDTLRCLPYDSSEISQTRWYYRHMLPLMQAIAPIVGDVLLHAACIVDDMAGPILLLGSRGAGKSTICAGLARSGAAVLSDDLVCISPSEDGEGLFITGQAPELHVPRAMAAHLGFTTDLAQRPDYLPGSGRIAVLAKELPRPASLCAAGQPLHIFVLAPVHHRGFEAREITSMPERMKLWWRHWPHDLVLCTPFEQARLAEFARGLMERSRMWQVTATQDFADPGAAGSLLCAVRKCIGRDRP